MPTIWLATDSVARAAAEREAARQENRRVLLAKVEQALQADLAYLALTNPTQADHAAQIKALTRQTVALIRLVGGLLDDVNGT